MRFQGVIFDADGTLLDSMPMWRNFGADYLRSCGKEPEPDIDKTIQPYSFRVAAEYFQQHYGVERSVEEMLRDFHELVGEQYREKISAKPGARALFERLSSLGVKMCVATSTDGALVRQAMDRLGLLPYLVDCISCGDYNTTKSLPDIFDRAAALMGTDRSNTAVFEDSYHCIQTVTRAGYFTVCVSDPFTAEYAGELRTLANYYLDRLDDFGWMDL